MNMHKYRVIYPFCNLVLVVTTAIIADILVHQGVNINIVKYVPVCPHTETPVFVFLDLSRLTSIMNQSIHHRLAYLLQRFLI